MGILATLKTMGTTQSEFHGAMAKAHGAAMESCEAGSPQEAFHRAAEDAHSAAAEKCTECVKAAAGEMLPSEKVALVESEADLDKVMPIVGISAVYSEDGPGARMVPRNGQPTEKQGAGVDPQLRKILFPTE